jgi:2'-5' RNA ligase
MTSACVISVLRFDSQTDDIIQTAIRRIGDLIGSPSLAAGSPHISLIPTTLEDRDGVIARMSERFENQPAIEIVFSHLGLFPGRVMFLGVTPSEVLITMHQQVYDASVPGPQAPWIDLYKPDKWVPHCTLSMAMPNKFLERAVTAIHECVAFPLVGTGVSIELLEVQPGKPLRTLRTFDLVAS